MEYMEYRHIRVIGGTDYCHVANCGNLFKRLAESRADLS